MSAAAADAAAAAIAGADSAHLTVARRVIEIERDAIEEIRAGLGAPFCRAVDALLALEGGKVFATGVGKSGHIARKIASTLASTGTPACFLHPTEAGHGDWGMVGEGDAVLALSFSGKNDELERNIAAPARRAGVRLLTMTGDPESPLAKAADISLVARVSREACPHNLAPTASAAAMLALGDALAMALLSARGFQVEDFARRHPAGDLGRRLLTRVGDIMRTGDALPLVGEDATLAEAVVEMSGKRMGMALIARDGALRGIFTDGDLRRALQSRAAAPETDLVAAPVTRFMSARPAAIESSALATAAARLMERKKISQLAVVDDGRIVGALTMHDLLSARIG